MRIAIDTQTILGQKSGFGFYNFSRNFRETACGRGEI
ncbi:MAG: hypothetical protein UT28_C0001G0374 [Berkelbacteria bacterium GW2011_GWE1_39_12]|uniref:Uncharacterized protein n=1 Tax=Berkelbacteria bacterium GW2011_GWE1_39_12 TaxID=1618337 RepID=A0A0G4B420_9BACT|nr:MAG: hypothetical protein UT28_C0001G0374 [Berkelbacteria bacterium GW2011_GWE1_39_12]